MPQTRGSESGDPGLASPRHPCAKRLTPFLGEFAFLLERLNHLKLTHEVHRKAVGISLVPLDWMLAPTRGLRKAATARKRKFVEPQIPIRTFSERVNGQPGGLEEDQVVLGGRSVSGTCLHTLTLTDVPTGWTDSLALPARDKNGGPPAMERALELFPFPILGLDTDNSPDLMNWELLALCQTRGVWFAWSRPYRKNDQCFVGQ